MVLNENSRAIATFGTGCFWCTEAVFQILKGVERVTSGYMGGQVDNPTYEQVSTGVTGHAECVRVVFDPAVITYETLMEVFWFSHDPTQPNRQGNDVGPQYRSVIFYHNEEQRKIAEEFRQEIDGQQLYPAPIVTEIVPAGVFYPAEAVHLNYFNNNGGKPYCSVIIKPKVGKIRRLFKDLMKG